MKQFLLAMTVAALTLSQHVTAQNRTLSLSADTRQLKVEQLQNTQQTVRLSRYLFAGYNTLCLPVSMSAEQLAAAASDLKVERLAGIRQVGADVQLYFVDCTADGVEAGVPYLIYSPSRQYLRVKNTDVQLINDAIRTIRLNDGQGNQIAFGSSWTMRQEDGLYGIPAKQDKEILESILVRTTAEQSFLPTRCGFSWEQQSGTASRLVIMHASASDVTAITAAKVDNAAGDAVYDLNGRSMSSPGQKGIYIQNGRKVVR